MPPVITIKGIDEAIASLNYRNQNSPKYLLVQAIRGRYVNEASVQSLESIDTETLIRSLWKTGHDRTVLRNRRKNLNSIRSSVNADLRRLYEADKNPEGIMIGPFNTFVMSDEAKDLALEAMRGEIGGENGTSPAQLGHILKTLKEFLTRSGPAKGFAPGGDPKTLNELMVLIRSLSKDMEMGGLKGGGDLPGSGSVDAPKGPGGGISQGPGDTGSGSRGREGSEGGPQEAPLTSGIPRGSSTEDLESVNEVVEIEEEIEPEGLEEVEDQADDLEEIAEEDVPDDSEFEEVVPGDGEMEDAGSFELLDSNEMEFEEAEADVEDLREIDIDEIEAVDDGGVSEIDEEGTAEESEELEDADDGDLADEDYEVIEQDSEEYAQEAEEDPGGTGDPQSGEMTESSDIEGGIDLPETSSDFLEAGLLVGVEESGRLLSDRGEENLNEVPGGKMGSRHLSEQFNHSLAAMDRFYNQYILIPRGTYTIGKKRPGRDDRSEQSLELPSL